MPVNVGEIEVVNEVSIAPTSVLEAGLVLPDGDLTIKVNAFHFDMGGTKGKFPGAIVQAVTDNNTNYVYLDEFQTLQITTVGYPAQTHIRLARVIASGGFVTRSILERALLGSAASTADHGSLTGLLDDDHIQYLLIDGTRSMTGDFDADGYSLINIATPVFATDGANKAYVDSQISGAWIEDEFTPTQSQVTFILSVGPSDTDSLTVYINGVAYDDVIDYTISGTTLTWLNNLFTLDPGDKLLARYI
jgi:hypothetical protein